MKNTKVVSQYTKKIRDSKSAGGFKEVTMYRYETRYKGIHIKKSDFKTQQLAKKALRERMNEIDEEYPDEISLAARKKRERLESVIFENVIDEFFTYKSLYVKDIRNVKEHFTIRITPFFKGMHLHKITQDDIEKWQLWLLDLKYIKKKVYIGKGKDKVLDLDNCIYKSYANQCIENSQIYLNEFFNFAKKKKYMAENPMDDVKRVKHVGEIKDEIVYWTNDEFKKFIDTVDDYIYNTLFTTLYFTGMRIGECLGLQWQFVNFETCTIMVKYTYNEKEHKLTSPKSERSKRTIAIPKKLCLQLKKLYDMQKDFDGFNGECFVFYLYKPMDDNTITRKKDYHCKLANVKRIKIHGFKHSHVSLLINAGFSAFEIAKRVGDTVDMILKTYAHLFAEKERSMANYLDDLY